MKTSKFKVLVTLKQPEPALRYLQQHVQVDTGNNEDPLTAEQLQSKLPRYDGALTIFGDRFDTAVFQKAPGLKVVSNVAVGYDNINIAAATKCGVLICNTPGVLDNTVADLTMGLLLAVTRRIPEADAYIRTGQWKKFRFDLLLGTDVWGKTIGLVGFGRIGKCVAKRARGFDMTILYSQRHRLSVQEEREHGVTYMRLDDLLAQSDFVSLHTPLTEETRHLIGERELQLMKPTSYLINTARGAVIDEQALVRALAAGKIAGAGLDVFANEPSPATELLSMTNVVLAPHIGSASMETRQRMAMLAAEGLVSALSGVLPRNAVNPEVWPEFSRRLQSSMANR